MVTTLTASSTTTLVATAACVAKSSVATVKTVLKVSSTTQLPGAVLHGAP